MLVDLLNNAPDPQPPISVVSGSLHPVLSSSSITNSIAANNSSTVTSPMSSLFLARSSSTPTSGTNIMPSGHLTNSSGSFSPALTGASASYSLGCAFPAGDSHITSGSAGFLSGCLHSGPDTPTTPAATSPTLGVTSCSSPCLFPPASTSASSAIYIGQKSGNLAATSSTGPGLLISASSGCARSTSSSGRHGAGL
ncbi:unnamed protein product, partial [Protopolystoma xenopodis]